MENTALVPIYTPGVPANEAARLRALERYQILDTPPEQAFETIVDLAVGALNMPIGLITFLDESRQWFKSRRGVAAPETLRDFSFCAQTILTTHGMIVSDALDDERFRYNPFVTGPPFIRFYAGAPLCTDNGEVIGSVGVADHVRRPDFGERQLATLHRLARLAMDEVELRLAQSQLQTEKHKLEFALKNAGMGQWSWNTADGDFELAAAISALVARHDGELPLSPDSSLDELLPYVHIHDRSQLRRAFSQLVERRVAMSVVFRVIANEKMFWVEVNADFAPGCEQTVIGSVRDVTEQEQWRAKSIRADRLHALSCLGAGVAHEINNPLSVVTTNLYLLSAWFKRNAEMASEKDREYIDRLLEMARRGATRVEDIVSSMLELSRDDETGDECTDACNVLESVVRLVQADIPAGTDLETSLHAAPPVRGRPSVLAQVFVNLLLNAIDAVERSSPQDQDNRIVVRCEARNSDWVDIEVHDTGPGVPPEERSRIFNPFFTTKPPGQGPGLGLAIAHSIVESLGGDISIESGDARGTTARVTLPVSKRPRTGRSNEHRPCVS